MDPFLVILILAGCGAFLTGCGKQESVNREAEINLEPESSTGGWEPQPDDETENDVMDELDGQENIGEPVVVGAEVICSNGEGSEDVLLLLGNGDNDVDMVGLKKMTKKDILLSNENKFKYCKFFASDCPGVEVKDNTWQLYNPKDDLGEDKNELDYNLSFMFCTKGWGIIYFKDSGQEMAECIENSNTCQFVGYLAYGAGGIVDESDGGFFKLYNAPTLRSEQEQIYFQSLYDKYGVKSNSALQSFGGNASLNKSGGLNYGNQSLNNGTLIYKGIERYAIAIAPKLQNPNCDLENLKAEDMAYGTCVDITIELDGNTYYIPAIIVDTKEHSAPEGIFQTGIPFDQNSSYVNTGEKGVIVEWYTQQKEDGMNKSEGLDKFGSNGSIIFYRDEVLE